MGMYTGLRCNVKLKDEFVPVIAQMIQNHEDEKWDCWEGLGYDFLDDFSKLGRSSFIPFGMLCYMPDEWEDDEEWNIRIDGNNWIFQCSLKNYESEIEYFLVNVLSKIIADIKHLEYYYEEWHTSNLFELKEGKIVLSNKEGIRYVSEESNYWF